MKMITTLKKVVENVNFEIVAKAIGGGMNNISSSDSGIDQFLEENGLSKIPHVLIADHSMGGRKWKVNDGHKPKFYEDECFSCGRWYALTNENCTFICCESATSMSSITAEKQENGQWMVTLEVPIEKKGRPYKGVYWHVFHKAIYQAINKEASASE